MLNVARVRGDPTFGNCSQFSPLRAFRSRKLSPEEKFEDQDHVKILTFLET